MKALCLNKLVVVTLMLLALSWSLGTTQQLASACQNPSRMVGRDEDLQQAIDQAPEGAVLELPPNVTYLVSLRITKSLTLCGQGNSTVIRGPKSQVGFSLLGIPAVLIWGEETIHVTFHNLTIMGTAFTNLPRGDEDHVGLVIRGRAQVQLHNVEVTGHGFNGILIRDSAVVTLSQAWITRNGLNSLPVGSGIVIHRSGQVMIEDSRIFENGLGVLINTSPSSSEPLQVTLRRSQVYDNRGGIDIHAFNPQGSPASDPVPVTIEDSNIFLNYSLGGGISILARSDDKAHPVSLGVSVVNSIVSANGGYGMSIFNAASQLIVELRRLTVESNGADLTSCRGPETLDGLFCDGIFLNELGDEQEETRVVIVDSVIRWNSGWGVAVGLKKCNSDYVAETFRGQLLFEGSNVIEGNNTAGYHQGEVCLP